MEYISVKEASDIWGIDTSRVGRLAREGRIEGARIVGRNWLIPKNAKKPPDGRTRQAKKASNGDTFRFPLYINHSEDSFSPPLNEEEKMLRQAQLDFFACNFDKSEEVFNKLYKSAGSIYIRQMALFHLCLISVENNGGCDFEKIYTGFELSMAEDFPHKQEMECVRKWLHVNLMMYKDVAENFTVLPKYNYNTDIFPLMAYLSFIKTEYSTFTDTSVASIDVYEIEVKRLETEGYILEALLLHFALIYHYFARSNKVNEEMIMFHIRKTLSIAYESNFLYPVTDGFVYYKTFIESALSDYPQEFADKIRCIGTDMYISFAKYAMKKETTNMYCKISDSELTFITYAVEGYSYKEIAGRMHVSERTVANRFAEIYNKLGVKSKQELLDMANAAISSKKG